MKRAEWFFDVVSPFAYLQLQRMADVEALAQVRLTPVLLAGLLNHWGQKGPAEIPAKRRALYRFVHWQAERSGVALKFPPAHPFNPIKALRLAIAAGCTPRVVRAIFRHIWAEGRSLEEEGEFRALCAEVGLPGPEAINDPSVKEALKHNGERAIAHEIFGVPSFVIEDEVFWGFDSTDLVIDYLRDPEHFSTAEHVRLQTLPIGARRTSR